MDQRRVFRVSSFLLSKELTNLKGCCCVLRPHSQLPELLKAIPYPPPAVLQTSLPTETTVTPVPQYSTIIPESTRIMLPVLPETVPLIAQVPDVVATTQQEKDKPKEIVEISQVLPGYARSYAVDYVPNEVSRGVLNVCWDFSFLMSFSR